MLEGPSQCVQGAPECRLCCSWAAAPHLHRAPPSFQDTNPPGLWHLLVNVLSEGKAKCFWSRPREVQSHPAWAAGGCNMLTWYWGEVSSFSHCPHGSPSSWAPQWHFWASHSWTWAFFFRTGLCLCGHQCTLQHCYLLLLPLFNFQPWTTTEMNHINQINQNQLISY